MERSINTLISEVTCIIRAYAADADGGDDEHWITLSNGSRVLISGNGDILAGMGGKFSGQKIRDIKDPDEQLNERESVSNALFGEKPARKQYHRIKADFEQKERVERLKKQEEAQRKEEEAESKKEKLASDLSADAIDKNSYGGYDMHKSDRELNTEAYDKHNGDEKKVHAEQMKISKQRDKYVDDNVKMFEKVGSEHGWEGTDVSRSRQSMSTYVTMQKDGYEAIEIRFSDHEDRHFANAVNLMSGNTAKENKQRLSAFLDKQKPLGAEDARKQGGTKNIQRLIADCYRAIRSYAADEAEEWVTLKNGAHVLIGEGGEIEAGLGGEHSGEKVQEIGQESQSKGTKTESISSTPSKSFSEDLKEHDGNHVKAAEAFYRREFRGKHVVANMGDMGEKEIMFTNEGIHEIRNKMRDNPLKAQIVPKIPDIIQKGEYLGKEEPHKDKDKDKKENTTYHYFKGKVEIGGREISAIVDVKERPGDKYEYSLYNLNYEGYPTWGTKVRKMSPQKTNSEDVSSVSRVFITSQQKTSSDTHIIHQPDSVFNIYIVE